MDKIKFSSRLKLLRKEAGLSQKELANEVNKTQVQISNLESGNAGTIETLIDVLELYHPTFIIRNLYGPDFSKSDIKKNVFQNPINSVVVERLKLLKEEINNEIGDNIKLLEQNKF